MTLGALHYVIQTAMGWSGGHLHDFVVGRLRYGEPELDFDMEGDVISEHETTVAAALQGVKTARYTYDFGDGWEHDIKVEALLAKHEGITVPTCVDGKNACPPEDCGGSPGYEEFLRIMADLTDPEHEERLEWVGVDAWDATEFDLDSVNEDLGRQS
jgi:hypothetical protein